MSDPASSAGAPAPLRTCEHCRTVLQGGYCHLCGQSEHSPVRGFWHAVEEVFESVWHLDGRIFRTLRDLFVPGRIADRYLAGHRACYVAPMRLFVILTALTFFVAQFLVGGGSQARIDGDDHMASATAAFRHAETVADVERIRDQRLAELARARDLAQEHGAGERTRIITARNSIRTQANTRIVQLRAEEASRAAPSGTDDPAAPEAAGPSYTDRLDERAEGIDRLGRNIDRLQHDYQAFLRMVLGAAPMTLFITVPLFAVLLKLFYLFKRRLYLEHVVIGLYSHAWLMLALLLYFLCSLAGDWLAPRAAWLAISLSWLQSLLLLTMPLYLLWMQKRVYRQSWPVTLIKYCMIGAVYTTLFATVAASVAIYVLYTM